MSNPSLANLNVEQVHASKQKALAELMQGVRKVGKGGCIRQDSAEESGKQVQEVRVQ